MADSENQAHAATKKQLRNKTEVHKFKVSLVGSPSSTLSASKLPTRQHILARYLGIRQEFELNEKKKESVKNISNIIVQELLIIWGKAALPVIRNDKVLNKMINLISEFENVLKHWKRFVESPDKLETYRKSLLALFDLAPTDIEDNLRLSYKTNTYWKEDLEFYKGQCAVPPVGSLGARDQVLANRLKMQKEREEAKIKQKKKQELESKKARIVLGDDPEVVEQPNDKDDNDYIPSKKAIKIEKNKTSKIELTSPIAVRHGLSARAHFALVAGTVQSMGGDINDMSASVSTLHRKRKAVCKSLAEGMCTDFNDKWKGWPKIVQWDGKIMKVLKQDGVTHEDVNVVVMNVPGSGEKLKTIAIPSVRQGTGAVLAQITIEKAKEWTDLEDVFAGSFDTTSANTGVKEGAMSHIEDLLGRKILWMPCRHHIAELHIKHAYQKLMGPTNSPEDPLFNAFKEWFINQRQTDKNFPPLDAQRTYDWGIEDEGATIGPLRKDENRLCRNTLTWVSEELQKNTFCRGDYRELCELIYYILSGKVCIDIIFFKFIDA